MWLACAVALLASGGVDPSTLGDAVAGAAPPGPTFVDVTSFGAVGDGVTDDTAAFLRAAASKRNLRIPKARAHYKLTAKIRVHASVVGEGLPEIRMYGADGSDAKAMLEVWSYAGPGLVISGLHLNGQWDGVAAAGEHSHLVIVKGSSNVTVEDNVLERPYGDGVYLGGGSNPQPSRDVVIRRNRIEGPRRCAIAVVSAVNARIAGNTLKKSNTYVAAIDVEPNPKGADLVDGLEIVGNEIDAPGTKAVLLYSWTRNPGVNRRVKLTGNTVRGRWFLRRNANGGSWEDILVSGNTYQGDPAGPAGEQVSFVDVAQDRSLAPLHVKGVVVDGNTIAVTLPGGQTYRDAFTNVQGLRFTNNRYVGALPYRVKISESPGAVISGNDPPGVVTVQ